MNLKNNFKSKKQLEIKICLIIFNNLSLKNEIFIEILI